MGWVEKLGRAAETGKCAFRALSLSEVCETAEGDAHPNGWKLGENSVRQPHLIVWLL